MNATLLLLTAALAAGAAKDKPLLLVFTGDNGGEIEPCGWKSHPTGGLARRATVIERAKKEGKPLLILDGGDALYKLPVRSGLNEKEREKETRKSEMILQSMGELGYAAMAVGERDLVYGVEPLVKGAAAAKLTLLAANLFKDGKPLFDARKVVKVGPAKVGLFGLSITPHESTQTGIVATDPVAAAKEQVAALKKEGVDLVVALAHLDYGDAVKVTNAVEGIDVMIEAHTQRVAQPEEHNGAMLLAAGERGRQVLKADLNLAGKGRFTVRTDAAQIKQDLEFIRAQIASIEQRIKDEPAQKATWSATLAQFQNRKKELEKSTQAPAEGRTLMQTIVTLDTGISDAEAWNKRVGAFVAKYGPTNQ